MISTDTEVDVACGMFSLLSVMPIPGTSPTALAHHSNYVDGDAIA